MWAACRWQKCAGTDSQQSEWSRGESDRVPEQRRKEKGAVKTQKKSSLSQNSESLRSSTKKRREMSLASFCMSLVVSLVLYVVGTSFVRSL
jgi:hypothetical protein